MYNLSIIIGLLIVIKNRLIIMTASSCCKVIRAVIGLCGTYQISGRRQLGARTRGIGQNIINGIFVILRQNL